MKAVLLTLIIGLKVFMTKGLSLGLILLTFVKKGKTLQYKSEKWNQFFLSLSFRQIQWYAVSIYTISSLLSSIVSYLTLRITKFRHCTLITVSIFVGGSFISACHYYTKGKAHIFSKWQEVRTSAQENLRNDA